MHADQKHFPRGAEWRQWDLHIHTPASFHWNGQRFDSNPDSPTNTKLVDEMIAALNAAEPAVFALMDYWTFDGWFALKKRLAEVDAPVLEKMVFPGIELRLAAPMEGRLNAHVLFSNEIGDQILHDFKSALTVEIIDRPLSNDALVKLARQTDEGKLKCHGFKKGEVDSSEQEALRAGSTIAEINCDTYKHAIEKVPSGQAIGFMPFDTNDGLKSVKWQEHYAYCLGLFKSSPIFETRNSDLRSALVGEVTVGNAGWIKNFQHWLGNTPRLAVAGSDAHRFTGVKGDNDKRGYGDFPSARATWIKADPTFLGLLQAIKEPANRSFIGELPEKLREVAENKTYFIDSVEVKKSEGSSIQEGWFADCRVPLNHDLVAIIGKKGSGKSALADVIALLGNSKKIEHFSFLSGKRFRKKPDELAKHFTGTIKWCGDQTPSRICLSDNPSAEAVELVRYIPQIHFEKLCNDHVSGQSDVFEKELRAVIFDHAGEAIRLGAFDFDQLIEEQESSFRDQLNEFRKDLKRLNHNIAEIEEQLQPKVKRSLQELLALKNTQIEEHIKIKPRVEPKPADKLTEEQKEAATGLEVISSKLKSLAEKAVANTNSELLFAGKLKAIQNVRERMRLLERSYRQFQDDTAKDLEVLGLNIDLATLTLSSQPLDLLSTTIPVEQAALRSATDDNAQEKERLQADQAAFNAKLAAPQLRYQENLEAIRVWEGKLSELKGTHDAPDSLDGLQSRIKQLEGLPNILAEHCDQRFKLAGEIFDILDAQRKAREQLFKPVQDLIQEDNLIRDEYKLQFQATLGGSPDVVATSLFALIKHSLGNVRGEEESYAAVKKIAEKYEFDKRNGILDFVNELNNEIRIASAGGDENAVGIASLVRKDKATKDKSAADVYDLLFGLSFLELGYSLLFQDTKIEQLSPGQRGALLLIFYLLVDKRRYPIILDQPEENLDNETVVSLLVPVLSKAKKKRQIIMVTHNPNLAVVCDAEQVIYSSFDRKNASKIEYVSGSIENPVINSHVVNVLEGTKRAFNNRRIKYH